jgi:hypothetical protein
MRLFGVLAALGALLLTSGAIAATKPLDVATAKLPNGNTDDLYDVHLKATGGNAPYTWSLAKGTLPRALKLSAAGELKGYPQNEGTWSFTVRVKDEDGRTSTQALSLKVADPIPQPMQIWWSYGNSYYPKLIPIELTLAHPVSFPIRVYRGSPPFTWSIADAPPGVTIDANTGVVTANPTARGPFTSTLTVRDSKGATASQTILFFVYTEPHVAVAALPDGKVGQPYSYALPVDGGKAPIAFALQSGSLPAGLSLDATSGTITGTPTQSGTFQLQFLLTDVQTRSSGTNVTLTIAP